MGYLDQTKVLVIGARKDSLGEAILREMYNYHHLSGVGAGLGAGTEATCMESFYLDVTDPQSILDAVSLIDPHHIVVTAGVPTRLSVGEHGFRKEFEEAFTVNVFGVIDVLNIWLQWLERKNEEEEVNRHFVAVSSNSAHIARTGSAGYCASKAALSMALRVAGREQARVGRVRVYGYEPGLLSGTPMTAATRAALGPIVPMTRMEGMPTGLPVKSVAKLIVENLNTDGRMLNGTLMRLDAGEQ